MVNLKIFLKIPQNITHDFSVFQRKTTDKSNLLCYTFSVEVVELKLPNEKSDSISEVCLRFTIGK